MRLSVTRNRLLKLDVIFSTFTTAFAGGAVVAGIFGMNLSSDVENAQYWFFGVTGLIVLGTIICVGYMWWYFERHGLLRGL